MAKVKLTIREGSKVRRSAQESLSDALDALQVQLSAIDPSRPTTRALSREFTPVQQVAARGEIAAPGGVRGGVDLRGDGSAEAWTGRFRRQIVETRRGESAYDALRRALS